VVQTPQGQIGHVALLFIARPRRRRSPRPPDAILAIPPRVHRHQSFSSRLDPVSALRASDLGFVVQPSNPKVLWLTAAKPPADYGREPLPCTSSYPRLRLAFLATMRLALDHAGHRVPQAEPTCLSTPWRPRKA
jgi:hypothetical protein